ncbi:hypothetical protein KIN20_002541 [Parelaphostrongylus tenuis]|uniref:Uncharacterized protein n=1 Tax=Parelaphostrongylus tenuis TaxID=148309 RepID=A0AAD5LZZ1_PARTN|nr:hypothetical protein KIN20_002541 [Parelaphostrongylus tenuis]
MLQAPVKQSTACPVDSLRRVDFHREIDYARNDEIEARIVQRERELQTWTIHCRIPSS